MDVASTQRPSAQLHVVICPLQHEAELYVLRDFFSEYCYFII